MKTDGIKKDYDKSEGCVIFLHIPRFGGTTFRSILNKCFNKCYTIKGNISHDEFLKFKNQPNEAEKYDCIMGHMGFGFHQCFPKSTYITTLRNPINRVISNYVRNKMLGNANCSLEEYVKKRCATNNVQTRLLCTTDGSMNDYYENMNAERKISQDDLELAKENLKKHFKLVGQLETFDLFLLLFKKEFNVDAMKIFYTKRNANIRKKRPEIYNVSEDDKKIIINHNNLDMDLYEYSKKLFNDKINEYDGDIYEDLKKFRIKNRIYDNIFSKKDKVYYIVRKNIF
jgi:hypothetical protein